MSQYLTYSENEVCSSLGIGVKVHVVQERVEELQSDDIKFKAGAQWGLGKKMKRRAWENNKVQRGHTSTFRPSLSCLGDIGSLSRGLHRKQCPHMSSRSERKQVREIFREVEDLGNFAE